MKFHVLLIHAGYVAASENDLFKNALRSGVIYDKSEVDIHLPGTWFFVSLYICKLVIVNNIYLSG